MREEFIKKQFEVNGTTVYDMGEEFAFFAKNEKGEDTEHYIAKVSPFQIDKNRQEKDVMKVLEAAIVFPNLPLSKAWDEWEKSKTNHGV